MKLNRDNTPNEERRLRLKDREQMTLRMAFSPTYQVRLNKYV